MRPRSLRGSLLLAVFIIVVASGLSVALLVGQRYGASLQEALQTRARGLARGLALQAADKVLINDLAALQKMLDHQIQGDASVSYLFLVRDGRVLAHTFERGVPTQLLEGFGPGPGGRPRLRRIISTQGERFLDIAWPVMEGKAGVLRVGVSERPYRQKLSRLWLQIGLLTMAILALALTAGAIFVGRISRPLAALSRAARKIDQGELDVRAETPPGQGEAAQLATSFNQMVQRLQDYTKKLERQALDLERAHRQTRASCEMFQEISGLRTLDEMRSSLMARMRGMLACDHMAILAFNQGKNLLFVLGEDSCKMFRDPELVREVKRTLEGIKKVAFPRPVPFHPPVVSALFSTAARQGVIPFRQGRLHGALAAACPAGCSCDTAALQSVGLVLSQAAGALGRAILHEEEIHGIVAPGADGFSGMVGRDPKMQVIYKLIQDVAPTDSTVLIQGESGTGKELAALAIHRRGPRRDQPFMVINCAAYPETLLESELFGHEKGAFTGALRRKAGRFEQADGGTVFLDEVGEISPQAQVKLLRVLQTHRFERLGGVQTLEMDLRVLAATNKDLLKKVQEGSFREDLYYRLNVIPLMLPPLRERRNDVPLLARHFLARFNQEQGKSIEGFGHEAMRLLLGHAWPGNVRELGNSIEHAVVLAKGDLVEAWDLPSALRAPAAPAAMTLAEQEKRLLRDTLKQCGWNKKMTAEQLGISRSALYDKIKRHGLKKPAAR